MRKIQFVLVALIGSLIVLSSVVQSQTLLSQTIPSINVISQADFSKQISWDTTAGWNSGSKNRIDTANDSCLASGQGFQLNATGGNYGVTARCPTGSPQISTTNISNSYDMSTNGTITNSTNTLLDLSGNGFDLLDEGTRNTNGMFGSSRFFSGFEPSFLYAPDSQLLLANFTLAAWGYLVAGDLNNSLEYGTLFGFINHAYYVNRLMVRAADNVIIWQQGAGPTTTFWLNSTHLRYSWHSYVFIKTFSNVSMYIDGTLLSTQTNSGFLTCGSFCNIQTSGGFRIGDDNSGFDRWTGAIDNVIISNRTWTQSEITAYSHIGSYATSGSWSSPIINVTNQYPAAIALGFRNQTSFSYMQSIRVFNASDNSEVWHTFDVSVAPGDSNVTYFILPSGNSWNRGNQSYYFTINLFSIGNSTVQVIYTAIIFANLPALPATITFGPTLDITAITLILLLFAFLVLFVVGFFERFAMVGAAIVAAIIAVLGWVWTNQIYVPAIFILMMAVCIGIAASKKVGST